MRPLLLATAVLVGATAPARAATGPSLTEVESLLRRDGSKATVNALWRSDRWRDVETRIGGGETRWIVLAPRLESGTDASTSEGLGVALAYALPRNPRSVLAVIDLSDVDGAIGVNRVCGVPFIEDMVRDIPAYRRRAARAVRAVQGSALASARAACLSALRRRWG